MTTALSGDNNKPVAKKESVFTDISGKRKANNTYHSALVWGTMILALIPLIWVLWTVISKGASPIAHADWWTMDQSSVRIKKPGGGAYHAIVGTLVQTLVAAVFSVPIAIFTAIYLVEYSNNNWLGKLTMFMVDILSGVPSIVSALFVYALWITGLHFNRSGFAVTLSLILLMIPIVVRNCEEMLRVVPMDLREASYALGVPKWKTIQKIVLPTALSGIVTGIMLAIARVMGESAPVLVLVGSTQVTNWNLFDGSQSSLPLMMLDMYKAGTDPAVLDKLWGAALTLVLIIAILNLAARWIAAKYSIKK